MSMAKSSQALHDAKRHAMLEMHAPAQTDRADAGKLKANAFRSAHRSGQWSVGGLGLFILALGSFGLSRYRVEPGSAVPFSILAIGYVLWLMLLV
jgi:hypothetical protein